jgi:hypothetical protein
MPVPAAVVVIAPLVVMNAFLLLALNKVLPKK